MMMIFEDEYEKRADSHTIYEFKGGIEEHGPSDMVKAATVLFPLPLHTEMHAEAQFQGTVGRKVRKQQAPHHTRKTSRIEEVSNLNDSSKGPLSEIRLQNQKKLGKEAGILIHGDHTIVVGV